MIEYYIIACWYFAVFGGICGLAAGVIKLLENYYYKHEAYRADESYWQ